MEKEGKEKEKKKVREVKRSFKMERAQRRGGRKDESSVRGIEREGVHGYERMH